MVKSANTNGLLDQDGSSRMAENQVKKFLHRSLQDKELQANDYEKLNAEKILSIQENFAAIQNPGKTCDRIWRNMCKLLHFIGQCRAKFINQSPSNLYEGESFQLAERRWQKLTRDFRKSTAQIGSVFYDCSKIPDIYDCVRYDLEHNSEVLSRGMLEDIWDNVKHMASIIVLQEYGITKEEKLKIAKGVCTPLMNKIKVDLQRCIEDIPEDDNLTRLDPQAFEGIATSMKHVRSRLYFTSESHIHSLMNMIQYGDLVSQNDHDSGAWNREMKFVSRLNEFSYLSKIVFMLYENMTKPVNSKERFYIELLMSPGAVPTSNNVPKTADGLMSTSIIDVPNLHAERRRKDSSCSGHIPASQDTKNKDIISNQRITSEKNNQDFVPPIRGLKTLHNGLSYKQTFDWLMRMTAP